MTDDELVEHHNKIADQHDLLSVWSVHRGDALDAPHPFPGAQVLFHRTIDGQAAWRGKGGCFEAAIPGPRCLDLWIAADKLIQQSGDLHHRLVESFWADPEKLTDLNMFAGS